MMRIIKLTAAMFLLLAATTGTHAAVITYADRASFDAAVPGTTLVDFETTSASLASSVTVGDVTFSQAGGRLYVFTPSAYSTNGSRYLNHNNNGSPDVVVTFATPVTAVGFDLGYLFNWGNSPEAGEFEIALSSGDVVSASAPEWYNSVVTGATLTFVGFVLDTPITSFVIGDPSDGTAIDNFAFATSSVPVPEPSSLALLALGAVGLAGHRCRWGNRSAT